MTTRLILGEALATLQTLPDASVDAVITDPPFGIGFVYGGGKEATDSPDSYWRWFGPVYAEMVRVLRPGGFLAVFQAQPYLRHLWDWFGDDIHVYAACKNFVQIRPTPINYAYDPVVMRYRPGGEPLRPRKPPRSADFFVADTAAVVSNARNAEKAHPCPRPLDQMREIVRNFALPAGTVLDCFMGSGTTGVACLRERRGFIGVEVREDYFAVAQRRIAEAEACRDGRGVGELFDFAAGGGP